MRWEAAGQTENREVSRPQPGPQEVEAWVTAWAHGPGRGAACRLCQDLRGLEGALPGTSWWQYLIL